MSVTLFNERTLPHTIDQVVMPSIEREEVVQDINFRSNLGTARQHELVERPFIP
jgi:hypothetical protein